MALLQILVRGCAYIRANSVLYVGEWLPEHEGRFHAAPLLAPEENADTVVVMGC